MYIQPRGYKRTSRGTALIDSIDREIERRAVRFNCSRSFVIASLLARQLSNSEQVQYDSYVQSRVSKDRRKGKTRTAKQGKRRAA